ncbi:MAG: GNAT family N-acetyltransferase, partial [Pseudomonadota bacterium]
MGDTVTIKTVDLKGPEIASLLQRHLEHMHAITPAERVNAL